MRIGVGVGGINDFTNSQGKPWVDNDPKMVRSFWKDKFNWYKSWQSSESTLKIDYIRIYAI